MSEYLSNMNQNFDNNLHPEISSQRPLDKLPLFIEDENHVDDFLDLKEVDPITNSSFEMMIKVAFRSDKNFILAKVKTRSLQNQKEQALS